MNRGNHRKTLLRALIDASGLPRRRAFAAIREGCVAVDGKTVVDPSSPFAGGSLTLDGRPLSPEAERQVYLMMNKPPGVLTASADRRGRSIVLDLVPVELRVRGLHAAGRLDLDTTGLLILTNDGDLTYRLTHPSHEIEKEYLLSSRPVLSETALARIQGGVEIDGTVRKPLDIRRLPPASSYEVAITLKEGRKRQVRRMVEAAGARVTKLTRVREGALKLGNLAEGSVRELNASEVGQILKGGPGQVRAR